MRQQQGLLLRGNRWHSTFKVPLDLQAALGKTHIQESLGTSDYREACRKVAYERARTAAFFESERRKAKLIIAKLDRLARNLHFVSGLMESGIEFLAVDNPTASRLTVHILAAVAEEEARAISARTKAALESAKARGVILGRHGAKLGMANHERAVQSANNLTATIGQLRGEGIKTVRAIAEALNARGLATPRGKLWHSTSVHRLLKRLQTIV